MSFICLFFYNEFFFRKLRVNWIWKTWWATKSLDPLQTISHSYLPVSSLEIKIVNPSFLFWKSLILSAITSKKSYIFCWGYGHLSSFNAFWGKLLQGNVPKRDKIIVLKLINIDTGVYNIFHYSPLSPWRKIII